MKRVDDLGFGDKRFLEVDNRLVLPISLNIQTNVTSRDVIHRFSIPTLGIKSDAAAGILRVLNFNIEKVGVHTGQCSEICGMNHRYMPIVVEGALFKAFYY
jgi:cytochrome c oxidase subunit 2